MIQKDKNLHWHCNLTSHNSGHTATLRSAQIRLRRTSYVRKTLDEMLLGVKNQDEEQTISNLG